MALENKFGIEDATELARVEEKISKRNAIKLFTKIILLIGRASFDLHSHSILREKM